MTSKQPRRSVSIRGSTYAQVSDYCRKANLTVSGYFEMLVAKHMGEPEVLDQLPDQQPAPDQQPEQQSATPAKPRKRLSKGSPADGASTESTDPLDGYIPANLQL